MHFPRLVYKSADVYTLAEDEQEHSELLKSGWFASVPEATAKKNDEKKEVKKAEGWNKPKNQDASI